MSNVPGLLKEALEIELNKAPVLAMQKYQDVLQDKSCREYLLDDDNDESKDKFQDHYQQTIDLIAKQLLAVSQFLFKEIKSNEMKEILSKESESVMQMNVEHKQLTDYVASCILEIEEVDKRAICAESWVAVMQKSMDIGDFQSTTAIDAAFKLELVQKAGIADSLSENAKQIIAEMNKMNEGVMHAEDIMSNRLDMIVPCVSVYREAVDHFEKQDKPQKKSKDKPAEKKKDFQDEITKSLHDLKKATILMLRKMQDNLSSSTKEELTHPLQQQLLKKISEKELKSNLEILAAHVEKTKDKQSDLLEDEELSQIIIPEVSPSVSLITEALEILGKSDSIYEEIFTELDELEPTEEAIMITNRFVLNIKKLTNTASFASVVTYINAKKNIYDDTPIYDLLETLAENYTELQALFKNMSSQNTKKLLNERDLPKAHNLEIRIRRASLIIRQPDTKAKVKEEDDD